MQYLVYSSHENWRYHLHQNQFQNQNNHLVSRWIARLRRQLDHQSYIDHLIYSGLHLNHQS